MQEVSIANSSTMNLFHTLYTEAMEIRKVFALNLESLREKRGISASELGRNVGVTAKHIYDLEKARKSPSIELLERIALYFSVAKSSLLEPSGAEVESEPNITAHELVEMMKLVSTLGRDELEMLKGNLESLSRPINVQSRKKSNQAL